tara:strand:- start:247 stop:1377 length:1131 start_codon:yes stop_codon:yes gene_type:complete
MSKAKRGNTIDGMYLGKEPSFTLDDLQGNDRKMAILECVNYYNYKYKCKDNVSVCLQWATDNMSKELGKKLKAAPAVYLSNSFTSLIRMTKRGWTLSTVEEKMIVDGIMRAISLTAVDPDEPVAKEVAVVRINPQQRLVAKIANTLLTDLDQFEDEWIAKITSNKYDIFKKAAEFGLSGVKIKAPVTDWVNERLIELQKAVSKNEADEEYVEAYRHIKPAQLRARITVLNNVLIDLDSLVLSSKATRKSRKPKSVTSEKQVAKLNYKTVDNDYKVSSFSPVDIIGAHFLMVLNTSNRQITEYNTTRVEGFQVKGSTLLHFDPADSRTNKLRNPDEFIKICLKKTPKQISKAGKALSTKASVPTGRFNKHMILLRVK